MKKALLLVLLTVTATLFADLPAVADADQSRGWISGVPFTPLQLGIGYFDRSQIFDGDAACFAAFSLLSLHQKSAVFSAAPLNVLQSNCAIQSAALLNLAENNYFLSIAPLSITYKNHAWQAGLLNSSFNSAGVQTGVINFGSRLQFGLINLCSTLQIGILNCEGKLQFGLLNYNPDAWLPWTPFFNFSRPKKTL